MLYDFLIFLPVALCVFWIVLLSMTASRISAFHSLVILLAVLAIFLYTDSCYAASHGVSYKLLSQVGLLAQLVGPCVPPLFWIYLFRLRSNEHIPSAHLLWLVFSAMLFGSGLNLMILAGPDAIADLCERLYTQGIDPTLRERNTTLYLYYIVTTIGFRIVLGGELVFYGTLIFRLQRQENLRLRHFNKVLHGGSIRVIEVQVYMVIILAVILVFKMLLFRNFIEDRQWIPTIFALLLSAVLFLFCFVGMFSARKHISLREVRNAFRFNYRSEDKDAFVEEIMTDLVEEAEEEALLRIKDKIGRNLNIEEWQHPTVPIEPPKSLTNSIFSAVAKSWDDDSLLARFENLMLHDQIFLEPGITLLEVAERLHSNKTYISRLVNNTYNMAFPDLINTLRVDYAEQYIVTHRGTKQADIATACGFFSASSFNNTFKKVTGMTPKIWLATFDHQAGLASGETSEQDENNGEVTEE